MASRLRVVIGDGLVLRCHGNDRARSHHVPRLNRLKSDQMADHLAFPGFEHALLRAQFRHRQKIGPRQYRLGRVAPQTSCDVLAQPHERRQYRRHQAQRVHGEGHEPLPVQRADRLGHDLREDQYSDRHGRGDHNPRYPRIRLLPDYGCLRAHAYGADRVGNGVQRQYRRQGTVDVGLEILEIPSHARALLRLHVRMTRRNAEQHRLPQRAEEGKNQRQQKKRKDQGIHERILYRASSATADRAPVSDARRRRSAA